MTWQNANLKMKKKQVKLVKVINYTMHNIQGHIQKSLKGGLNFSKSNQYPIVDNLVIVKQNFAVIVASSQHLSIQKPCNNDFESC